MSSEQETLTGRGCAFSQLGPLASIRDPNWFMIFSMNSNSISILATLLRSTESSRFPVGRPIHFSTHGNLHDRYCLGLYSNNPRNPNRWQPEK
jgi:hypothetical protein